MDAKLPLAASAVVLVIYGIAFLFAPGPVLRIYNVELAGAGLVVAQLFGAAILGLGVIDWLVRGILREGPFRGPILLGNFVYFLAGFFALLFGRLTLPGPNQLVWFNVVLYLVFALAFGVLLFGRRAAP